MGGLNETIFYIEGKNRIETFQFYTFINKVSDVDVGKPNMTTFLGLVNFR